MFEREYRDLSYVSRWAIIPTIKRQSVAEHSYYVALYATHIMFKLNLDPRFTLPAIYRALEHDREEVFTGDIPGPVKKGMGVGHDNTYTMLEEAKRFRAPNWQNADPVSLAVVKLADVMDQYAFFKEEGKMGNGRAGQLIKDTVPRLEQVADRLGELTNNNVRDRVLSEFYIECEKEKVLP